MPNFHTDYLSSDCWLEISLNAPRIISELAKNNIISVYQLVDKFSWTGDGSTGELWGALREFVREPASSKKDFLTTYIVCARDRTTANISGYGGDRLLAGPRAFYESLSIPLVWMISSKKKKKTSRKGEKIRNDIAAGREWRGWAMRSLNNDLHSKTLLGVEQHALLRCSHNGCTVWSVPEASTEYSETNHASSLLV